MVKQSSTLSSYYTYLHLIQRHNVMTFRSQVLSFRMLATRAGGVHVTVGASKWCVEERIRSVCGLCCSLCYRLYESAKERGGLE